MKIHNLRIRKIFKAEQVNGKPYYGLPSYRRELTFLQDVLAIHLQRIDRWVTGKDDGSAFNTEFKELISEIVEQGDMPQPRREAVEQFYAETMAKLDDPKDRMILCQCIASLDDGEDLNLGEMYTDDFNAALIEYKEAKNDE